MLKYENESAERIVLPTERNKGGEGIGSGRDFISGCFRNSAWEAYRSRYLVARTEVRKWFPDSSCVGGAPRP